MVTVWHWEPSSCFLSPEKKVSLPGGFQEAAAEPTRATEPGLCSRPHLSPPSKRAKSSCSLLDLSTLEVGPVTARKGELPPWPGKTSWGRSSKLGLETPKGAFPKGSSLAQSRERPLNQQLFPPVRQKFSTCGSQPFCQASISKNIYIMIHSSSRITVMK